MPLFIAIEKDIFKIIYIFLIKAAIATEKP